MNTTPISEVAKGLLDTSNDKFDTTPEGIRYNTTPSPFEDKTVVLGDNSIHTLLDEWLDSRKHCNDIMVKATLRQPISSTELMNAMQQIIEHNDRAMSEIIDSIK